MPSKVMKKWQKPTKPKWKKPTKPWKKPTKPWKKPTKPWKKPTKPQSPKAWAGGGGNQAENDALAAYLGGRANSCPKVSNTGEQRLTDDLIGIILKSGIPCRGTVNGPRLGSLDEGWSRLKGRNGVVTALLGKTVDMKPGMHVTLPKEASKYKGQSKEIRLKKVNPKFGWGGGQKWVAIEVELNLDGKGFTNHWPPWGKPPQHLHMSIGIRK